MPLKLFCHFLIALLFLTVELKVFILDTCVLLDVRFVNILHLKKLYFLIVFNVTIVTLQAVFCIHVTCLCYLLNVSLLSGIRRYFRFL